MLHTLDTLAEFLRVVVLTAYHVQAGQGLPAPTHYSDTVH